MRIVRSVYCGGNMTQISAAALQPAYFVRPAIRQDQVEASSLYDQLENEIVPLYYQIRSSDGLPGDWIARMKESIRTISPQFSMRRMVKEYMERLYLPELQGRIPEETAPEIA